MATSRSAKEDHYGFAWWLNPGRPAWQATNGAGFLKRVVESMER